MQAMARGRLEYLPTYEAMRAFTAARGEATADELWLCEHPPVFTQGLAGRAGHVRDAGPIPVIATDRGGQVTYHGPGQVVAYPLLDLRRAGYFVKEYVYRLEEAVIRTLAEFGVTGHRVAGAPGIYVRLDDPFSHAALPKRTVLGGLPQRTVIGGAPKTAVLGGLPKTAVIDGLPKRAVIAGLTRNPGDLKSWIPGQARDDNTGHSFDGLGKIAALGIKVSRHCAYHGVALNVAMDLEPFERINPCGYAGLKTVDLSTIGVSTTWNEAAHVLGQKLDTLLSP